MEQLSPQDSQFLYVESENNLTHVTFITIFDPSTVPGKTPVRFDDIVRHIDERLGMNPLLKRRLVRVPLELDYPYWAEDPYFDLKYHLRNERLPEPGDWREFCIYMARYHSRPLNMHRPLWEMLILQGLDNIEGLPKGSFGIATKIHHSAVDGASLVQFTYAITDSDNIGTPMLPLDQSSPSPGRSPTWLEMTGRAAWNRLTSPARFGAALVRSMPSIYQAAQEVVGVGKAGARAHPVPHTRFNVELSPHKVFDATVFALDDLKLIKRAVEGSTINDVVLTICGGALRTYLSKHKELPEEPLVACAPVNVRPGGSADTSTPGNHLSAMTTPIHTNITDPLERLKAIKASTAASKDAHSGLPVRLMTDLTQHIPAATQALASRFMVNSGWASKICNLLVSNFPGPQQPLYMQGAKTWGNYGLAPLGDGIGLFIATPSFDGKMTFNVTSTREIMPDCLFFVDCLENAFEELLAAAAPPATTNAKAKVEKPKVASRKKQKVRPTSRARTPQKKASTTKKTM
ncbi:MAG: wax ester/triacylglycerol synthase family O-acyltransferase [Pseudomonadota bacterium]